MKTLNVMLSDLNGKILPLGYEGENLYTRVQINCIQVFSEYPDAVVSMVVRPPVGDMYPAAVEKSGVMVVWDITDSVLSSSGQGQVQLTFTNGEIIRKSVIFGISINSSLVANGEAPEPVQEWIDSANETAHQIAHDAAMEAAEEVIESIPEDYTEMSNDVRNLKSALSSDVEILDAEIMNALTGEGLLFKSGTPTWEDGAIYYSNGNEVESNNFKRTGMINIKDADTLCVTIPVYKTSGGTQAMYGLAFYTGAQAYISGYQMPLASRNNTAIKARIPIPSNARYFRTTWYKDTYSDYDYSDGYSAYFVKTATGQAMPVYNVLLGQDEINEYAAITDSFFFQASNFGLTSYIDCKGVDTISVKMPILSSSIKNTVGLAFYNSSKTQIRFYAANRGDANSAEIRTIEVPTNAEYFRCTYWNYTNSVNYGGDWYCSFKTSEYGKNRPYQSGYIFYSPLVNQSVNQYWEDDLATELGGTMKQTTGVLLLPESYTPNGKPTPVIMYFHGLSHAVYYDTWGADDDFRTQKAQWAAQGLAVIDCNGARNNNMQTGFTSGGALQYSAGYHACFEYVKQHYNVEQYCHVICASAGGIPGINYCFWFNDAKSLLMLSAWTSLKNNSYYVGQTASMIEYLGCDFTDGYDEDRTVGFDPTLRIIDVDNTKYLPGLKIPSKAVMGDAEDAHISTNLTNFITALRNAGQSANLRIVTGASHKDICSSDILALNTEYANWCKTVG